MKRSDTLLTVRTDAPAYGGLSIGRLEGKVLFIRGAIPGETVAARIEVEKKDYSLAAATRILIPSPERVEPPCPVFGTCGGCQYQYLSGEGQRHLKEAVLRDCLRRTAKTESDLSEPLFLPMTWSYRRRGQFKYSHGEIGFYREHTRRIVAVEQCPLMEDSVNEYLGKAKESLDEAGLGLLTDAEIHITCGDRPLCLIKTSARDRRGVSWDESASLFLGRGFAGLWILKAPDVLLRYGSPYTTFDLGGLSYTVSPMSFFQSNWRLNQVVTRFLKETLQPLRGKRIVDLYAGAGNFCLLLAQQAGEVIAVEENLFSVEDGRRNASINGIENCRFVRSAAEDVAIDGPVDILILDPPRSGLTKGVIEKIEQMRPERIVSLSCNPATLARDLRKLLTRYDIESLRMIDFFPQTYHIESLAFLRLK